MSEFESPKTDWSEILPPWVTGESGKWKLHLLFMAACLFVAYLNMAGHGEFYYVGPVIDSAFAFAGGVLNGIISLHFYREVNDE